MESGVSHGPRFWTCHWQNRYWKDDANNEGAPIRGSGSNSFVKRGVSPGDVIYIVSLLDGQLMLGGRMVVERIILSRDEAVRFWNTDNLFDAREWIVARDGASTPLNLHRQLAPALARRLEFISRKSGRRPLFFLTDTHLSGQATRGVHELTHESAALLERVLVATDSMQNSDELVTVTEQFVDASTESTGQSFDEVAERSTQDAVYREGDVQQSLVNRYERDRRAREACIAHYGTSCILCGFDFVEIYGHSMAGFIHVHHLSALATIGPGYLVNPIRDLRPVCANCHAVLHHRTPPFSLDEVRVLLERRDSEPIIADARH